MKKLITTAIMAVSMPLMMMAQEQFPVTGKISILNNTYPIQNMEVKSLRTGETVRSNQDGVFQITTCDKDELSIECYPFKRAAYKVKSKAKGDTITMGLTFPRKPELLTQIIDNGYLDKKYEETAYNTLIFRKDWTKYTDIEQAIAVEFPSLRMMGAGCYQLAGSTDSDCMLVVAGNREVSVSEIPITNVEDITILKGSQATLWGKRGINGVILIKIKNTDVDMIDND